MLGDSIVVVARIQMSLLMGSVVMSAHLATLVLWDLSRLYLARMAYTLHIINHQYVHRVHEGFIVLMESLP